MGQANYSGGTPTKFYYNKDHLGSIREMTESTGAVQTRYLYNPYGVVTETFVSGTTSADKQYSGYYIHVRSALNMPLYRLYNANLGKFINRDPIGESGGLNLFTYAANAPTRIVDPSGLLVQIGYRDAAGPYQHMAVVLSPDNPADFAANALFQGINLATLAGEPEFANAPPWGPFGNLIKKANDPSDFPCRLHDITNIPTPPGMTDTEFINKIIEAFNSYADDAPYNPYFPRGIENANSNSFAAGLIHNAGSFIPLAPATGRGPLNAPGGEYPMHLPYVPSNPHRYQRQLHW